MAIEIQAEKKMATEIQPGDYVAWRFGSGEARGHVLEKLTQTKKLNARTFKASEEEPKFLISCDKSGKEVIRKPDTLRKIDENEDGHDQTRDRPSHEGGGTESDEMSSHEDGITETKDGGAAAVGNGKQDGDLEP